MDIDWENLGFEFRPTKSNFRCHYADGKWSDGALFDTYDITMSVAANCLHYGQAVFEGLKAFRCRDGKVRVFRPQANAKRLNDSARYLLMPELPAELFLKALRTVINDNLDYIPPYGTGGALYIRPVMFGTSPQIGISASKEYEFVMLVVPVGAYYRGGIKPMKAMISSDVDRAAPRGTGHIKMAGNYAASLYPSKLAKEKGCSVALFMDPASHEYVDEFGTSNFLAITKDGKYVTPKSASVLPSITNMSLMQVAEDCGLTVERRPVKRCELGDFAEIAACGTAVVITPVGHLYDGDKVYTYSQEIGPTLKKIYDQITGIQYGELPDRHNWMYEV